MIEVQGVAGRRVAVLGLGRSGLSSARALMAGGAHVLAWDDMPGPRDRAASEGFERISRPRCEIRLSSRHR